MEAEKTLDDKIDQLGVELRKNRPRLKSNFCKLFATLSGWFNPGCSQPLNPLRIEINSTFSTRVSSTKAAFTALGWNSPDWYRVDSDLDDCIPKLWTDFWRFMPARQKWVDFIPAKSTCERGITREWSISEAIDIQCEPANDTNESKTLSAHCVLLSKSAFQFYITTNCQVWNFYLK